jgi:hypothetical protein
LPTPAYLDALGAGLQGLGQIEGRNLIIDTCRCDRRSAAALKAELLNVRSQVLVAQGVIVLGGRTADCTVPIVFGCSVDPVEGCLASCLARPGCALTGCTARYRPHWRRLKQARAWPTTATNRPPSPRQDRPPSSGATSPSG